MVEAINRVLDGRSHNAWKGAILGEGGAHYNACAQYAVFRAKTAETIEIAFGLRTRVGPRNHVLDGVLAQGIFQERTFYGMPDDTVPSAVQKWLNRSIEMLFGLGTRVGPSRHVLRRVHAGVTHRIPLNRPCVAAMRLFCQMT